MSSSDMASAAALQRLRSLDADIRRDEAGLSQLEAEAKRAIQMENAEEVSHLWTQKRTLSEQLRELREQRANAYLELQVTVERQLAEASASAEAAMSRLRSEQETILFELSRVVQRLQLLTGQLSKVPASWASEHQAYRERIRTVMHEAMPDLATFTSARPIQQAAGNSEWWGQIPDRTEEETIQCWAVYDVDSGRIVQSAQELLRVLLRWWPQLPSDEERVKRFLTLPQARLLPESLKEQLQEARLMDRELGPDAAPHHKQAYVSQAVSVAEETGFDR